MTYYLGKAGSLIALPDPEVGLSTVTERIGGTHQLISGARVRDTLGYARTWQLNWTAIDLTTYGTLQSLNRGLHGVGPFVLLDPELRNMLTLDQSSGTGQTATTAGFTSTASVTLTSSTDTSATGLRSLLATWASGVTVGAGYFQPNPTPIYAGVPYSWRVGGLFSAGTASFHYKANLVWLDSAGAYISEATGTSVQPTFSWSVNSTGTATAPANAGYATVHVYNDTLTTSITSVYFDAMQIELGSTVNPWVPGSGAPLVTIDSLSRTTPLAGICDAQMTLVQVG